MALWNMSRLSSNLIELQAEQNAAVFTRALDEARILYSEEVVKRVRELEGITISENYQDLHGGIPNPATYTINLGDRVSMDGSGTIAKIYSNYPFPNRLETGGPQDSFETEALESLEKNPTKPFFRKESFNGRLSFRYATAMTMQQSCVDCHNTHPSSPKKDWQVGDVRGGDSINSTPGFDRGTHSGWLARNLYYVRGIVRDRVVWHCFSHWSIAPRCQTIGTSGD